MKLARQWVRPRPGRPLALPGRAQRGDRDRAERPAGGLGARRARRPPRRGSPRPTTGSTPSTPRACSTNSTPESREAIVARLWGGLTFEEIARLQGCSLTTAHRRYQSGHGPVTRKARTLMDPTEDSPEGDLTDLERRLRQWQPAPSAWTATGCSSRPVEPPPGPRSGDGFRSDRPPPRRWSPSGSAFCSSASAASVRPWKSGSLEHSTVPKPPRRRSSRAGPSPIVERPPSPDSYLVLTRNMLVGRPGNPAIASARHNACRPGPERRASAPGPRIGWSDQFLIRVGSRSAVGWVKRAPHRPAHERSPSVPGLRKEFPCCQPGIEVVSRSRGWCWPAVPAMALGGRSPEGGKAGRGQEIHGVRPDRDPDLPQPGPHARAQVSALAAGVGSNPRRRGPDLHPARPRDDRTPNEIHGAGSNGWLDLPPDKFPIDEARKLVDQLKPQARAARLRSQAADLQLELHPARAKGKLHRDPPARRPGDAQLDAAAAAQSSAWKSPRKNMMTRSGRSRPASRLAGMSAKGRS